MSLIDLTVSQGTWPGVRSFRLFEETYFPACSPGYRRKARESLATPADLRRLRLIHVLGEREDWSAYFQRLGLTAPPAAEGVQFDSLYIALHCCLADGGVLLATAPLLDPFLADSRLVELFAERFPARHAHYLVVPDSGDMAADIAAVVAFLSPG